jgi:hypothetical protein
MRQTAKKGAERKREGLLKLAQGLKTYQDGGVFKIKNITKFMKLNNVTTNDFYALVKANYITKHSHGTYSLNKEKLSGLTPEDVVKKTIAKKQRIQKYQNATIRFKEAVALIKSMGGKVLMPTSSFEEL